MGKKKDVGKTKITAIESCMLRTLNQVQKIKMRDIIKDRKRYFGFAKFSQATIYRHAKKPLDGSALVDKQAFNTEQPRKITACDMRRIRRQICILRNDVGTFTSEELQEYCGVTHVTNDTFRRYRQRGVYKCRRTRKKGLLTSKDLANRLRFVRKVKRNFKHGSISLWTHGISMYLDAVGFEFKRNPYLHSKTP